MGEGTRLPSTYSSSKKDNRGFWGKAVVEDVVSSRGGVLIGAPWVLSVLSVPSGTADIM
jgi:hypothetical protein